MFGNDVPVSIEPWQGIPLLFSNLLFIPAIFAALLRKANYLAAFLTLTAAISTVYHFCVADYVCLVDREALGDADFVFAMTTSALLFDYTLCWDAPRTKGRWDLVRYLLMSIYFAIIIIRIRVNREADATFFWLIGASLFISIFKTILVDKFDIGIYRDYYYWGLYLTGIFVSVSGLSLFFFATTNEYYIIHSLWHIAISIGASFFILSKRCLDWTLEKEVSL